MKQAVLFTSDGGVLPVGVASSGALRLVECREPAAFLRHLGFPGKDLRLSSDTYVRGVILPGDGAVFQLRDAFGIVADDVFRLDRREAENLLNDLE